MVQRLPIIAIIGPTGAGKTRLSVEIAKAVNGEVISLDSIQVYRDSKIMSGQVTKKEMQNIPHYFVDYMAASEELTDFVPSAIAAIRSIRRKGKLPILCGGSISLTEPLLLHAFMRRQNVLVIALRGQLRALGKLSDSRIDGMLEEGLLEEVQHLYELEQEQSNGEDLRGRGVWKSIGYPELRPFCKMKDIQSRAIAVQQGIVLMKARTRSYAELQLENMWERLLPALYRQQHFIYVLNVEKKETFGVDVELPALEHCKQWLRAERIHAPRETTL